MKCLNIKGMIFLELQITQTRHPLSISDGKNVKANTPQNKKISMKCAQNQGAHLQCVNIIIQNLNITE